MSKIFEELTINKMRRASDAQVIEFPVAASAGFIKTSAGTTTLIPASPDIDRVVFITVNITTSFAAGDGAAPTFSIGQTGSVASFASTAQVTGAANAQLQFSGVLSKGNALIVTATTGTGTTETGALTINALACKNG